MCPGPLRATRSSNPFPDPPSCRAGLQDLRLAGLPPGAALALVGGSILDASSSRESLIVHRIVIGEGRDFPELRDWFFAHAVMPSQAILTEYLEGEIAA